ncbi:acyltransferase family protein [Nocardioides sp.]|uniref:acyltransferase family protein n=1 Tax=Nocardioides sp. TaxID=35761 RepID=UPI0039E26361
MTPSRAPRGERARHWRPDIQGLRALAVGGVVLAHAGLPCLPGGFVGVDVFFVISGFLITSLLLRELDATRRLGIAAFYARRARRILPAATYVAVATLLATYFVVPLIRMRDYAADAGWSMAFLANVRFAATDTDYWATNVGSPFRHYWSLAVEEQFYLVWPLVLVLMWRLLGARGAFWGTAALTVASLAWSVSSTAEAPIGAYYSSPARAYELLIGGLLAMAAGRLTRLLTAARLATPLGLAGLAGVLATMAFLPAASAFPGWLALLPTLSAALLIAAGIARAGPVSTALGLPPLRLLGEISYSLYLWHWPVLVLGGKLLPDRWHTLGVALLVLVSVVLAVVTRLLVERPVLRAPWLTRRVGRSLALWPVSIGMVTAAALTASAAAEVTLEAQRPVATGHQTAQDIPTELTTTTVEEALSQAVALARAAAPVDPLVDYQGHRPDIWFKRHICSAWWQASTVRICPVGDTASRHTVVVLGDSHAGMWVHPLDILGRQAGYRVVPLVKHACSPFDYEQTLEGKPFQACEKFRAWARGQIANLRPDAVVVASRGFQQPRLDDGEEIADLWSAAVTSAVTTLTQLTPRVLVLSDVPGRAEKADDCVFTPGNSQLDCLAPEYGSKEQDSNAYTRAAVAAVPGARYVDVVPLVCQDGGCPVLVEGRFVYFDDNHITWGWSETIAQEFGERLGQLLP